MSMTTHGTRRTLAIGFVSAALLGAAALGALRAHPGLRGAAASVDGAASAAEGARDDGSTLPARRWEPGASFVYEVSTRGTAAVKTKAAPAQEAAVELTGTLAVTVLARAGEVVTLRGELREGSLRQGQKTLAAAELGAPFYATAAVTGELSSFRFSRRLPPEARVALQSLAASIQMVAPEGRRAAWQARELDTTGLYEASYRLEGSSVRRTKLRYLAGREGSGVAPFAAGTTVAVQSTTDFEVDASGWPRRVDEVDAIEMRWGEGLTMSGSSRSRAALRRIEARPDLVALGIEGEITSESQDRAEARAANDRQVVSGKTFTQLAADVRSPDTGARNRTQAQLAALLRVEPAAAVQAEEAILRGDLDENGKKRIAAALGAAGTPEAQRALADVLGTQGAPAARRMDAAIALAQVKQPTAEAASALDAAMGAADPGVAGTATLASGAVVNQVNAAAGNTQDYGPTKDAVQKLVDGLRSAGDDHARLVYLQALGNTGDLRAWPAIQPFLAGPNLTLRAAAAFSLRFLAGPAIDEALVATFRDPDAGVRRAGASTLSYRAEVLPLMAAIEALMKGEPDMSVRLAVIEGLKFKLGEDESVEKLVAWAAQNDGASEVRNLARQVLATLRS